MDELWMVLESSERRRHSDFLLDVQLELGIFDEISLLWSERTSSSASQPRLKVDEARGKVAYKLEASTKVFHQPSPPILAVLDRQSRLGRLHREVRGVLER
jgi:hypothetical protein